MKQLYKLLYNIAVGAYTAGIHLATPFNPKAKLMVEGRRHSVLDATEVISSDITRRVILIHVASLGEFEQARPIIERLRQEHPEYKIVLTFFSPSGYEQMKHYELVDKVTYLPFDTTRNKYRSIKSFIGLLQPAMVIFVKYEFWLRTLAYLRKQNIPTFLVSAIFRADQPFFKKGYGELFRDALSTFETIFVQNKASAELLKGIGFTNTVVAGDTRIDRVAKIKEQVFSLPEIEALRNVATSRGQKVVIAGSSWPQDEAILIPYLLAHSDNALPIVVPHEIHEEHIQQILKLANRKATRYSEWDGTKPEEIQLLVIDKIGLLSKLYRFGDIAYIGGGFGKGIHNTLEPAVYSIPVVFGPRYHKFREAHALIAAKGGFSISNQEEFAKVFDRLLTDTKYLTATRQASGEVIETQRGATDIIFEHIFGTTK